MSACSDELMDAWARLTQAPKCSFEFEESPQTVDALVTVPEVEECAGVDDDLFCSDEHSAYRLGELTEEEIRRKP